MKHQTLPFAVIALMSSSALVAPAAAQNAQADAQTEMSCDDVAVFLDENRDQLNQDYLGNAEQRVGQGDAVECQAVYQEASTAIDDAAAGAEVDAEIVVSQPAPDVQVQQQSPQVEVSQPDPNVTVNQGQPQVIVRQQPPQVNVEVPQPRVTIDMPQPEIIIRMPNPDVNVDQPQPQVEVRQPQPQVNVEQGQPQIRVEEEAASGDEEADISVQQSQAQVMVEDDGQDNANVDVQTAEPQVQYEAAEPEVTVENVGEPEILFNQSEEPNVRFEEGGAQGEAGQQEAGQQNAGQQNAGQQDGAAALIRATEQDTQVAGEPVAYTLDDLVGQTLANTRGDELGTIESVVVADDVRYVVLSSDSPLSSGDAGVVLPLENIVVVSGEPMFRGLDEAQMNELGQFDAGAAEPVQPDAELMIETQDQ